MPEPTYPVVTVPLHQLEQLRRTLSHFAELHAQADVILSDLRDLVLNMPDAEDSPQVPYHESEER